MRDLFDCGTRCKRKAGRWYILSVLLVVTAFSDGVPEAVKGICFLAGGASLVLALLFYRAGVRHQSK